MLSWRVDKSKEGVAEHSSYSGWTLKKILYVVSVPDGMGMQFEARETEVVLRDTLDLTFQSLMF